MVNLKFESEPKQNNNPGDGGGNKLGKKMKNLAMAGVVLSGLSAEGILNEQGAEAKENKGKIEMTDKEYEQREVSACLDRIKQLKDERIIKIEVLRFASKLSSPDLEKIDGDPGDGTYTVTLPSNEVSGGQIEKSWQLLKKAADSKHGDPELNLFYKAFENRRLKR